MGFKNEDKLRVLEFMRSKYVERKDDVQRAMSQIGDEDLTAEKHIKTYVKRLSELKELNQLTYSQIGNLFNVSHTTIENIMTRTCFLKKKQPKTEETNTEEKSEKENTEETNSKKPKYYDIDRTFLEIFSLFFGVSPLYLIGKECRVNAPLRYDDDGKLIETKPSTFAAAYDSIGYLQPFIVINDDILIATHSIIYHLFPTAVGRDLLIDFLKLCDAVESLQCTVKRQFLETPYFKKMFSQTVVKVDNEQWRDFQDANFQHRFTISRCISVLNRLGELDYDLLKLFANISILACKDKNENALCKIKTIHDWLELCGFFQDNRLFCGKCTIEKSCNDFFAIKIPVEYTFEAKTDEEIRKQRDILISNIGLDYI